MVKEERIRGGQAVSIVAIVCAEAIRRVVDAGFLQDGHVARLMKILLYAASTLGYPTLFFLFGLSTVACLQRSRVHLLKSVALTVLYPYLLWSILQTGVQWVVAEYRDYSLQQIGSTRLAWAPVGQFWFLYALFICQIVACITVWPRSTTSGSALTAANRGVIAALAVIGAIVATRSHWGIVTMTCWGLVFFLSGMLFASRRNGQSERAAPGLPVALFAGIAFAAAATTAQPFGDYLNIYSLPVSFLGIAAAISIGTCLATWQSSRWIVSLCSSWKPVYLLHVLAIAAIWNALLALGIRQPVVHVVLGIAAGLAVPIAIHLITKRAGIAAWAGFEEPAATRCEDTEISDLAARTQRKAVKSRA
ncbi:acyltransferase family protein [Paraburkholderia xenovorans]|uniref:acyltransferase family protein n=1 Tax=Paraburkholderia xenovorans TaxID=36873 RepID=UPI0015597A9E|nr:acyltransferase [Paraburkholderia xenovorans]NPT38227.1 acyltransferase family protein [Paraburkholderia xenovorans]